MVDSEMLMLNSCFSLVIVCLYNQLDWLPTDKCHEVAMIYVIDHLMLGQRKFDIYF
jgi:hypothetical protein